MDYGLCAQKKSLFQVKECPGVMVKWSNHLTMTMAKMSKLLRSNGQNWSFLTMTMAKIEAELSNAGGRTN